MTRILLIGQQPETVDFTDPNLPYGFDVDTIDKSLQSSLRSITDRGWHGDLLQVMPDETAPAKITTWLASNEPYHCVVIGAGVRIPARNLRFFESVVNAVHRAAPDSLIGFNTRPEETAGVAAELIANR